MLKFKRLNGVMCLYIKRLYDTIEEGKKELGKWADYSNENMLTSVDGQVIFYGFIPKNFIKKTDLILNPESKKWVEFSKE